MYTAIYQQRENFEDFRTAPFMEEKREWFFPRNQIPITPKRVFLACAADCQVTGSMWLPSLIPTGSESQ